MADELILGKYSILRSIASGGMGEVFLAKETCGGAAGFERHVILKTLLPELEGDPAFVTQFLDEARVAATLNHPNVVALHEVGLWKGHYFIAMEYVEGRTLAELVASSRPLAAAEIARIGREACLALHHAHTAVSLDGKPLRIVHRDVSPPNVMIRKDGVTKVLDFGIASASNRRARATATGTVKGKIGYLSPEQARGKPLTGASDQFALGVVLWEACTRRRLFGGDAAMASLAKILEPVPRPSALAPSVPPDLEAVVMRMLEKEPEKRFPSCLEAAEKLKGVESRLIVGAAPPVARSPAPWIGGAVGVAAAFALGIAVGGLRAAPAPAPIPTKSREAPAPAPAAELRPGISGSVVRHAGRAVRVEARSADNLDVHGANPRHDGAFVIRDVPDGAYRFRLLVDDAVVLEKQVQVTSASSAPLGTFDVEELAPRRRPGRP